MKKKLIVLALVSFVLSLGVLTAFASLSTSGAISLVSAPSSVLKGVTQSDEQIFLFKEQTDFKLTKSVALDITTPGTYVSPSAQLSPGELGADNCVNSYFLHMDLVTGREYLGGSVTFDEEVIGLITENTQLDASDWLGAPGTFYAKAADGETSRRVELTVDSVGRDRVTLSADKKTVSVNLWVNTIWTDQIRILTQGTCDIEVDIDIKPGSDPSCFNNNGRGVIPVAIFGKNDFDVYLIDVESIRLEGLEVATQGKSNKYLAAYEDFNNDGFQDLVIKFKDVAGTFSKGDEFANLTGNLLDGTPIFGTGDICITQEKFTVPSDLFSFLRNYDR